jgi:hypothetical protein
MQSLAALSRKSLKPYQALQKKTKQEKPAMLGQKCSDMAGFVLFYISLSHYTQQFHQHVSFEYV